MTDRWRPEWQHAGWCATRSRSYNDCDCGLGPLLALLEDDLEDVPAMLAEARRKLWDSAAGGPSGSVV